MWKPCSEREKNRFPFFVKSGQQRNRRVSHSCSLDAKLTVHWQTARCIEMALDVENTQRV